MKKECPWCAAAVPNLGQLPEAKNAVVRAAECPSCKRAIRISPKEQWAYVAALPFSISLFVNFISESLVPSWVLLVLAVPAAAALFVIRSTKPVRVNAI